MPEWFQQALTPPEVIEVNVRLGVIPTTDHAQVLVEVSDPVAKVLIAQWSVPHERWSSWPHMLDSALAKAQQLAGDALEPF